MENKFYYPENNNFNGNWKNKSNFGRQIKISRPPQNIGENKNLLGVFELLSISWKMFLERWTKFVLLALLLIVIQVGLQFLFGLVLFPIIFSLFAAGGQFSFIVFFIVMAIMAIVFSIPSLLLGIAIIEIIKNKDLGVIESINKSSGKLVPYIKVFIAGGLIMICFFAIFFISLALLFAGLSYALGSSSSVLASVLNIVNWLTGFTVILVIIPMVLIMQIWIFFALLAVVLEGMRPAAALSYSYELIKRKMLSLVWKFIVAASLFILIVLGMFIMAGAFPSLAIIMVPLILLFYFIGIFTLLIFYYNIYENLKALKINEISENFEAKNSGKIKLLAIGGAAIVGLFLAASVVFTAQFRSIFSDFIIIDRVLRSKEDRVNPDIIAPYENNAPLIKEEPINRSSEENDKIRKKDLEFISNVLWRYKIKNGAYPVSPSISKLNEDNEAVRKIKSAGNANIPADPKKGYYYGYVSLDGISFELTARLEDLSDSNCAGQEKICLYKVKSRL